MTVSLNPVDSTDMSNDAQEGFETRAIHRGRDFVGETGAVTPPVWLTSTFEYGNPNGFDYTRSGNPNFKIGRAHV